MIDDKLSEHLKQKAIRLVQEANIQKQESTTPISWYLRLWRILRGR